MGHRPTSRVLRRGGRVTAAGLLLAIGAFVVTPGAGVHGTAPQAATPAGAARLDLASRYRPGEVLVGYVAGVDAARRGDIRGGHGLARKRALQVQGAVDLVRITDGASVAQTVRELRDVPGVAYAEPNYLTVDQLVPNDPQFATTWVHRNLGGASWTVLDADLDTPQAWDLSTGSSTVRIGIADSGLAATHEDLAANLFTNTADPVNGVDDDANGYVDDRHGWDFVDQDNDPADTNGHGSMMAGVAAAVGNNGVGVTGVNWHAAIVPLRRLDAASVAEAFTYAGHMNLRVVNASFALGVSTPVANAIAGAPNTIFVASAGNDGGDNDTRSDPYPCQVPSANVICVASSDADDTLSDFSAYGMSSVDLAAPGGWGVSSTQPTWNLQAYAQNFDAGWGGWTHGTISGTDRWGLHGGAGVGGTTALSDSPGTDYAANSQTWAQSPTFSLVGKDGCIVRQTWRGTLTGANLAFDFSTNGTTWRSPGYYYGLPATFTTASIDTTGIEGSATARFRYRLWTGSSVADGATIDDVKVLCLGATQNAYETVSGGTSSAAAFVTGAIGLLLSHEPALTPAQVRSRLLTSVDKRPAFLDKVASDGRLNVARLLGAPIRPENATAPVTSGTFTRGQTVHCSSGTWAESPTSFTYAWTRDGTPIADATWPDHTLGADDGLAQVGCTVTATNADGSTTASSVAKRVASPPVNTAPPSISGDPTPGATLTCTPGTWRYGPVTTDFFFNRDGYWLANGQTHVVTESDRGHTLTCVERATNSDGIVAATSAGVAVAPKPPVTTTTTTTTTPPPTTGTQSTSTGSSLPPLVVKTGISSGQHLLTVLKRGLRVRCAASRPGRCTVVVTISAREARRVGLKTRGLTKLTLGSASVTLSSSSTRTFTVKVATGYARVLRRARSVRVTLSARARDARQVTGTATATVTVRR